MTRISFLVQISVLTVSTAMGGPGLSSVTRPQAQQDAINRLANVQPSVQFYQEGTRLTQVYGAAFGGGENAEAAADAFRQNFAQVFGVSAASLDPRGPLEDQSHTQLMMFDSMTGTYKFTLVYYTQYQDGVPVFRADLRLLVRNEPGYPLVLANSSLRDLAGYRVPARPAVNANLAQKAAQGLYPAMNSFTPARQVIWAGYDNIEAQPALALEFIGETLNAPNPQSYEKWLFVCDAATGAILFKENQVCTVDVAGSVKAMATDGIGADICNTVSLQPMPYATVSISGGSSAFADANGNFVIPNGGSSSVTVNSPMSGRYFNVVEQSGTAGLPESLSQSATPPGPANFVHNSANTSALIRAEVNAYIQANRVRDYLLTYKPNYPTIATQLNFTINTNIASTCNAFYNGSSINFYQAGGGCSNTANSDVVWHEYGHHVVQTGGSGQGQYGEGTGDCMGVIISDQPVLGRGFQNNCSAGIRTAANNVQYPCGSGNAACSTGEIHCCGQLISGCVWSTRNQLIVTNPATYRNIISSLCINAVPLHQGSTITPQITIDYLTLDDDDASISNGTPHYNEINTGFTAHNMPGPALSLVSFSYPDGRPALVTPNQTNTIRVNVNPLGAQPVSGTGRVSYRVGGSGAFTTVSMTETSANQYVATLPAATCPQSIEYYFTVDHNLSGSVSDPSNAPVAVFSTVAATGITNALVDDFEQNRGWTVGDPSVPDTATTGIWTRVDPVGTAAQPEDDHTPAPGTMCFVTGQGVVGGALGDNDVDNGKTTLMSPTLDLSGLIEPRVSYWRWYSNSTGSAPNADIFVIDISNNNGTSWVTAEVVGPATENTGGWIYHELRVGDFVAPTSQVKLRFIASDTGSGSIVEAALDDFAAFGYSCAPTCGVATGDINGDSAVDGIDVQAYVAALIGTPTPQQICAGDFNANSALDAGDTPGMVNALLTAP